MGSKSRRLRRRASAREASRAPPQSPPHLPPRSSRSPNLRPDEAKRARAPPRRLGPDSRRRLDARSSPRSRAARGGSAHAAPRHANARTVPHPPKKDAELNRNRATSPARRNVDATARYSSPPSSDASPPAPDASNRRVHPRPARRRDPPRPAPTPRSTRWSRARPRGDAELVGGVRSVRGVGRERDDVRVVLRVGATRRLPFRDVVGSGLDDVGVHRWHA